MLTSCRCTTSHWKSMTCATPSRKQFGTIRIPVANARPATVKNACIGFRSRLRTAIRKVCERTCNARPLEQRGR